jgi:hypothetical protein
MPPNGPPNFLQSEHFLPLFLAMLLGIAALLSVASGWRAPSSASAARPSGCHCVVRQAEASRRWSPACAVRMRPSTSLKPTLTGLLRVDVMRATGAKIGASTSFLVRAIDGYAVVLSASEATERRFILATHLDGRPVGLGDLGPI